MSINLEPKTKAWVLLITLVVGTGSAATVAAYLGGAKMWVSVLIGVGTGATNVYHALNSSPNEP